jgi:luciferase family oxidoreductase group 1
MVPISILDLAPIAAGSDASRALRNTLDLAQHAEGWGYRRFWLAEHHNMPGIASAATAVVIAHVAGGTRTIRVGAGGVMLPNHAPLVIAEQFGTLAALFPGRIELGLGRAPGTDMLTAQALRRGLTAEGEDTFPQDVLELQAYFKAVQPGQKIRAVPGAGLEVPLWLLGSSLYSAQLAAMLGLPFAFASHFAPDLMEPAVEVYRARFRPSAQLARPYAILGLNVYAADTDGEARRLFTSVEQQFAALRRGEPGPLPPPVDTMDGRWSEAERARAEHALACAVIGSAETVRDGVRAFVTRHAPDEIMATALIFDHPARVRSFEILAEVGRDLGAPMGAASELASADEVRKR